ncbi:MAG: M12 family metallo-peptidase [Planctomycetia bacterium]|jgi:hypothetical protein
MYTLPTKYRSFLLGGLAIVLCCVVAGSVEAGVIVFSNKTKQPVTFIIGNDAKDTESHKAYRITAGDVLSVPVSKEKMVWFDAMQQPLVPVKEGEKPARDIKSAKVAINSIYLFDRNVFKDNGAVKLKHFFSAAKAAEPKVRQPGDLDKVFEIPIIILVDDEEPRKRELWERDLRNRMKLTSDLFEKTCRIRFKIVKVDTWETTDGQTNFEKTLNEFQARVRPEPGVAIAIGFTSQYEVQNRKQFHMGGTRGILYPYILIREWSNHVGKSERLEILIHELGHVFGATHTPDQSSVMRPVTGDKQSNARGFRIGFDPLNTLAMYLLCEAVRFEGVRHIHQLSPAAKTKLVSVYKELERRFPSDPSVARYRLMMEQFGQFQLKSEEIKQIRLSHLQHDKTTLKATAMVVRMIALQARQLDSVTSDERFEKCIQAAADAVKDLPAGLAERAMAIGIGIALDSSGQLRDLPGFQEIYDQIVPPEQRKKNRKTIGKLSIRGETAWADQFAVTMGKCFLLSPSESQVEAFGRWWNPKDGQTTADLRDLAINIAAARFATLMMVEKISPKKIAKKFDIDEILPNESFFKAIDKPTDLKTLKERFGGPGDPRFQKLLISIYRQTSLQEEE